MRHGIISSMDQIAHMPDAWTALRTGGLILAFFWVAIVLPSLAFCALAPRFLDERRPPPC